MVFARTRDFSLASKRLLNRFFDGDATALELARCRRLKRQVSDDVFVVDIEDMENEYNVTRDMAMRLVRAMLPKELLPEALAAIGFCLMASDKPMTGMFAQFSS
jgi:hypothetical protein